jgi:hypothetical protein
MWNVYAKEMKKRIILNTIMKILKMKITMTDEKY